MNDAHPARSTQYSALPHPSLRSEGGTGTGRLHARLTPRQLGRFISLLVIASNLSLL